MDERAVAHDGKRRVRERVLQRAGGRRAGGERRPERVDDVRRLSGASQERIVEFFAKGMLLNVVAALELPDDLVPAPPDDAPSDGAAASE